MTFNDKQLAMVNANSFSRYLKGVRELPLLYNFVGDGSGLTAAGSADASSGTIPTDIANLLSWLDASDPTTLFTDSGLTTPVTSDGDPVGGWVKSGGQFQAGQSTGSRRPQYKTNVINGLSVVRFDGSDDFMGMGAFGKPASFTIICVVVRSTLAGRRYAFGSASGGTGGFNNWGWLFSDSSNDPANPRFAISIGGTTNSQWQTDDAHFVSDVPILITQRYATGNTIGDCKVDGVAAPVTSSQTAANTNSGSPAVFSLGRKGSHDTRFWLGDIAEFMVYDAALSDGDIADLEATLITKWAI